jgi:hypothetical protein
VAVALIKKFLNKKKKKTPKKKKKKKKSDFWIFKFGPSLSAVRLGHTTRILAGPACRDCWVVD